MNVSVEEEREIFNYLHDLGCCVNCCLRYLCDKSVDFSNVDSALAQKKLLLDGDDEKPSKKQRSNPCLVCVGLLQSYTLDDILAHDDLKQSDKYDSGTFTVSISVPASVLVREHAMRIHLEDKFGSIFTDENIEIPLNRVWKMYVKGAVSERVGKTFENSDTCDFFLNVSTEYANDGDELAPLKEMQPKMFETRSVQHRKYNGELYSRKGVVAALERTSSALFKLHSPVPPDVPTEHLRCKTIECKHNSIYIAGRYCKYSRELSQSPWIVDGVKTMETSVQEIIFSAINNVFGIPEENMKFSSSGREDCDVRCLGKGRPFYVEFMDPKKTEFTFKEFREAEVVINSTPLIKVTDLQKVKRSDLVKIKDGEESKTKTYVALCVTKVPVTPEMLEKLNDLGPIEIAQKTPVRVLHRRPLAVRNRRIQIIKAVAVEGRANFFELHMETQAGTYVKEFVHGDFERTKPNVGDIIKTETDIAGLDVVSINLDWPEPVFYEQ